MNSQKSKDGLPSESATSASSESTSAPSNPTLREQLQQSTQLLEESIRMLTEEDPVGEAANLGHDDSPFDKKGETVWPPYLVQCLVCKEQRVEVKKGHVIPLACPSCSLKFREQSCPPLDMRLGASGPAAAAAPGEQPVIGVCTVCIRGLEGVGWCSTCSEVLCDECEEQHHVGRKTHTHVISKHKPTKIGTPEGEEVSPLIQHCLIHKEEAVSLFCIDCEVKLCNSCLGTDVSHAKHNVKALEQVLAELRNHVNTAMEDMSIMLAVEMETERRLEEKVEMLAAEEENLRSEAAAQFTKLLSAITKKEKAIRKDISLEIASRVKLQNEKRAEVDSFMQQVRQFRYITSTLRHCTDDQILLDSRDIILRFEELKKQYESALETQSGFVEDGHQFVVDKSIEAEIESLIKKMGELSYVNEPQGREHQTKPEVMPSRSSIGNSISQQSSPPTLGQPRLPQGIQRSDSPQPTEPVLEANESCKKKKKEKPDGSND